MGEERFKAEFQVAENDIAQAKSMCSFYDDANVRKKAFCSYIALGTFIDYIKHLGLEISPHTSISRVMKIVEDFDLSNISYGDLQLDIRVSVNSDYMFVPKIHFDYGIVPDIYIGAKLSPDFKKIEFLGYVEASQLQNMPLNGEGFYYLRSDELSPFENLVTSLQKNSETAVYYDDDECEQISELFLKYFDGGLDQNEKVYLVKHLMSCIACKCRFIDFYEFDILMKKYKDHKDIYAEYQQNNENSFDIPKPVLPFEQMVDVVQEVAENIPTEAVIAEQVVQNVAEDIVTEVAENVVENVAEEVVENAAEEVAITFEDAIQDTAEEVESIADTTSETVEDLLDTPDDLLDLSIDDSLALSGDIDDMVLDNIDDIKTDEPEIKSILRKSTPVEEVQEQFTDILHFEEPEENKLEKQNDELVFDNDNIEVLDFLDSPVENKEEVVEENEEEPVYLEIEIDSDEEDEKQEELQQENFQDETQQQEEENAMLTDDVFEIKEEDNSSNDLEFEETEFETNPATEVTNETEIANVNDEVTIVEESLSFEDAQPATDETATVIEEEQITTVSEPIVEKSASQAQELYSNEQIKELYSQPQTNKLPKEIEDAVFAPKKGMSPLVKSGILLVGVIIVLSIIFLFTSNVKKPVQNDAPIVEEKMNDLSGLESQNPTGEDDMAEPVENDTNSSQNMNNAMAGGFSGHNTMIISKISWSVSAQIAQLTQVKNYLQAVGKDIQVNLQNDLDQAADFSYNDKIKVGMTISEGGKVKSIKIINGSGSPEIDKIVKNSITQTIEERNFPVIPEIKGDTNFNLIIIF